jgi:non-canonical purine NTP pyrophosphatase (RdgB/HAM1 family)
MKIAFATGNDLKFLAAVEHLAALPVDLEQVRLDLDEIQSVDVGAVALHKARQAFRVLGRPLIAEDSGFGIDELGGYPGPMAKFTVAAIGAEGIARLADLTATRACRYTSCLVYVDGRGEPHAFTDDEPCTVAPEPAGPVLAEAWSALWNVVIPAGCSLPLAALPPAERERDLDQWRQRSTFRQFGDWLTASGGSATG